MSESADPNLGFEKVFERLLAELKGHSQGTLGQYIELEKRSIEEYRKYVESELSRQDQALQSFTKMVMASWLELMTFHRENRSRLMKVHDSLANARLQLLEQLKDSLLAVDRSEEG